MAKNPAGKPGDPQKSGDPQAVQLPVSFNLFFLVAAGLTIIALCIGVILSLLPADRQTDNVQRLIETCSSSWKLGFGVIIGLVGGKIAR